MSRTKSLQSIGHLQVGQLVRMTKRRHIPGAPVLEKSSWCEEVTEGTIDGIRRIDGGVMILIAGKEFFVAVSPIGPRLLGELVILEQAPEQLSLMSGKAGAA